MTRTYHHKRGDNTKIKKCRAGSKKVPRKWWTEGKIINRFIRKQHGLEDIKIT